MAIPANVIFIWTGTNASIPAGWSRETALDTTYIKGTANAVDPNTTGGALTHSHTTTTHNHSGAHTHTIPNSGAGSGSTNRDTGTTRPPDTHDHVSNADASAPVTTANLPDDTPNSSTDNNEPPYYKVIFIKSDGTPTGVPDTAVGIWNNTSAPTSWNLCDGVSGRPDLRNKYLKGADVAGDAGATGGATSHAHTILSHTHTGNYSHDHPTVTSSQTTASAVGGHVSGAQAATADLAHTHNLTINSQATDVITGNTDVVSSGANEPPYTIQGFVQNNKGSDDLPVSIIGIWLGSLGAIPVGWNLCDGTNSTPDLRDQYIKGANTLTDIGTIGGSTTHGHTSTGHTHTVASHTHTISVADGSSSNETAGSTACAISTHTHSSWTNTGATLFTTDTSAPVVSDYTTTEPPYTTVAYIQFSGAQTYTDSITESVDSLDTPTVVAQFVKSIVENVVSIDTISAGIVSTTEAAITENASSLDTPTVVAQSVLSIEEDTNGFDIPTVVAQFVKSIVENLTQSEGVPFFVTDDFNRPDGPLGSNWTDQYTAATIQVYSNAAYATATLTKCSAFWSTDSFSPDQYSQASVIIAGDNYRGLTVRMVGTGGGVGVNGYCVIFGTTTAYLYRVDDSIITLLQSISYPGIMSDGSIVKLSITGSTLRFYVDGVQYGTDQTDTTYSTGSPGIFGYRFQGNCLLDNWEGGNVIIAPPSEVIDTLDAQGQYLVDDTESIDSGDTISATLGAILASVVENIAGVDDLSITASLVASITEAVGVTDAAPVIATFLKAIIENANATNVPSKVVSFIASALESTGAVDSLSSTTTFVRYVLESLSSTDSPTSTAVFLKSVIENAVATDATLIGVFASIEENINSSDTLSALYAGVVDALENISLADTSSSILETSASVTEEITPTDTLDQILSTLVSILESTNSTDNLSVTAAFVASLIESVSSADISDGSLFGIALASILENVDSTDVVAAIVRAYVANIVRVTTLNTQTSTLTNVVARCSSITSVTARTPNISSVTTMNPKLDSIIVFTSTGRITL